MIVDCRVRPPAYGFLDNVMYANRARTIANMSVRGFTAPPSVVNADLQDLLREMDEAGIDVGVVPGRMPNKSFGGLPNRDIARIVAEAPTRFVGVGSADLSTLDQALADVDECMTSGFKAIAIEPGLLDFPLYLDDRRLYPVYEKIQAAGLVIFAMVGGNAGPDLSYASPLAADHVAADFPNLTWVLVHGGWPWVQETLGLAFRRPNVWISPDLYLLDMPGWRDYVDCANSYLQDRFLFASCYPFCSLQEYVDRFTRLPLSEFVLDKLLWKNATTLLGLELPPGAQR